MVRKAFVLAFAIFVVACGGATTGAPLGEGGMEGGNDEGGSDEAGNDEAGNDAASDASPADGGEFACGDSLCGAEQICVYPPCGCIEVSEPPNDAGSCPDGFEYTDASGGFCVITPTCPSPYAPPYCQTLAPGTPLYCAGEGDGSLSGNISGPLPAGGARICHLVCA
jgi:hypothetical protein